MAIEPGTVIAGKYKVAQAIGRGRAAEVYYANHVQNGALVALKVLSPAMSTDREWNERFTREAQILATLRHPNVAGIYEFGRTAEGWFFMAMEALRGETLARALRTGGPLELGRALRLLDQLLVTLEFAHGNGVVHRDVRPANIILTRDERGEELVKVMDFGVARTGSSDSKALTAFGSVLGMPEYAAPEQLRGQAVDARTDLYAVGCVAFEMLCGAPPFQGGSQVEVMVAQMSKEPPHLRERAPGRALPPALDDWVQRALAKTPDKRWPDAARMRMVLGGIVAGLAARPPEVIGEAVVPLGGEVVPGYVDLAHAPAASRAPIRAAAAAAPAGSMASAPAASPPAPAPRATTPVRAPAAAPGGPWKAIAIAAGVALVVAIAVVVVLLTR